jgi:DNA primase
MSKRYPDDYLRRLRNEIPLPNVFRVLEWPHKKRDGYVRFLCPVCQEFDTAVNPPTNLGRCFRCEQNFNPIDFLIRVRGYDFPTAVSFLAAFLPPRPPRQPSPAK